jgi:glycerophosphoryl diester phosphodiesterase
LVNNQCDINIEVKEIKAVKSILDLIDSNIFSKDKILISSFDWNALQEVRFHDDEIRIGVLIETDLELAIAFAKFMQAYSIHPYYHLLTPENCQKMKNNRLKIFTWTVNEPEDIIFVKSLYVDGIITDFPDRV